MCIRDSSNILLVVAPQRAEEAVTRLSRVGIDNTLGFLEGGMEGWIKKGYKVEGIQSISANDFEKELVSEDIIIDVRNNNEYEKNHLMGSKFLPLGEFSKNHKQYDSNKKLFIHCQGGYRSMIACSLLKRKGLNNITAVSYTHLTLPTTGSV